MSSTTTTRDQPVGAENRVTGSDQRVHG
jgi:hypothetical protein